jgi:hypothetical protein
MWSEYLNNPTLYAIDIDSKSVPASVSFDRIDQSNKLMLQQYVADKHELFDLIIDDGSHVPAHQILTLECLWEGLKPGSCYVIEDIETCYWERSVIYGYEFDARERRDNIIKSLGTVVDRINSEFISRHPNPPIPGQVFDQVDMVMVGSNCVCLVKKNPEQWGTYYNRVYRCESSIDCNSPVAKLKRLLMRLINR